MFFINFFIGFMNNESKDNRKIYIFIRNLYAKNGNENGNEIFCIND